MIFITYFLSKALPLIFSPLGISILLLIIFTFKKKKRFVISSLTILIIFSTGIFANFLWILIEYPWKRIEINSLKNANAVIVLSGYNLSTRFTSGIKIYEGKKAKKIIFTNGKNPYSQNPSPKGNVYIKKAKSIGIPIDDIYTTYPVLNTFQEAKAINYLIKNNVDLKKENIILVTSAFHMKRAKKIFEREGIIVQPFPVDFINFEFRKTLSNPLEWLPSYRNLGKSSIAFREIIGRIVYRVW